MKKITLLLILFVNSTFLGQQVLSHSTDNSNTTGGSLACTADPDMNPASGDELVSDNIYYRAYTPANFGFSGDFFIMGGQFFLRYNDIGGSGTAGFLTLRFFTSDAPFPDGNLTEIGSQMFQVDGTTDTTTITQILLDSPITVDASTEIIIAVDAPASNTAPNNIDYRIAINTFGESNPSYLSSNACNIPTPSTFESIGFPTNNLILDLIGDGTLSTQDNVLADSVSMYPNPTSGDMNIFFSRSLGEVSIQFTNISGQIVMETSIDTIGISTLNTSRLSPGIYFAQIATKDTSTVIKFIKN